MSSHVQGLRGGQGDPREAVDRFEVGVERQKLGAGLHGVGGDPDVVRRDGRSFGAEGGGDSLEGLIGSWSTAEEAEFLRAISGLEAVDPSLWP